MVATTTASISSIVRILQKKYPHITFKAANVARWAPKNCTVYYTAKEPDSVATLLHELGHALLNHTSFVYDIDLIKIERDAWDYASKHLAKDLNVTIPNLIIQQHLDSYRDWLHKKSTCPHCNTTGVNIKPLTYQCPSCHQRWKANRAVSCRLQRRKVK